LAGHQGLLLGDVTDHFSKHLVYISIGLPSMNIDEHIIVGISVALGCGLLIGIERERRKGTGSHRALAGADSIRIRNARW